MKKNFIKKCLSLILTFAIISTTATGLVGCGKEDEVKTLTYKVTLTCSEGGTLNADQKEVEFGSPVKFNLHANSGYVLTSFTINGGEVTPLQLSSASGYNYSYTLTAATKNYNVKAEYGKSDVTVKFISDSATTPNDISVSYGKPFGTLPKVWKEGYRFNGWVDENGESVKSASLVKKAGEIKLTATWKLLTENEKTGLEPFTLTTSYYDAQATKIGVAWHTMTEPAYSVVEVVKCNDGNPDWSKAITGDGEYSFWRGEYVSSAVAEGLEFNTTYCARVGDKVGGVYGKTYTFTTREEEIDCAKFFYVCDTQVTFAQKRIKQELAKYNKDNLSESEYAQKLANGEIYAKYYNTWDSGLRTAYDQYIGGDTFFGQVMRAATAKFDDAGFIAHGGDIVNYGGEPAYWEEMMGSIEEYLFNLPLMPTAGNHETMYIAGNYENIAKIFNIDTASPDDGTDLGVYYSFDYGPVHFVSLRDNEYYLADNHGDFSEEQYAWLTNDLAKAKENPDIKWSICMLHEGPTWGTNVQSYSPRLCTIMQQGGVDLVLFGHNHTITSTFPVAWRGGTTSADVKFSNFAKVGDTNDSMRESYDGDLVNYFSYTSEDERGMIIHQTACTGDQANTTGMNKYSGIWRAVCGGGGFDENEYSMYSYIVAESDGNGGSRLVLRTYGVNVWQLYHDEIGAGKTITDEMLKDDYTQYIDGFVLKKSK